MQTTELSPVRPDVGQPVATAACANCGAPLSGRFCHQCGQKVEGRLSLKELVTGVTRQLANLDFALLRTLTQLSVHPGRVARAFISGRRRPYSNPIKYAVLMATLYALAVNIVPWEPQEGNAYAIQFSKAMGSLISYLILVVLLPVAALQRWLFRESGFNTAEWYVFLLYVYAEMFALNTIFVLSGAWYTGIGLRVLQVMGTAFMSWALMEFHSIKVYVAVPVAIVIMNLSRLLGLGLALLLFALFRGSLW